MDCPVAGRAMYDVTSGHLLKVLCTGCQRVGLSKSMVGSREEPEAFFFSGFTPLPSADIKSKMYALLLFSY